MKTKLTITIITVLSLAMVMTSGMALNGVLPGIRDAMGITQSQSELIVTVPPLASLVAVLSSTLILKAVGMKRATIIGLLLIGIGGMVPAFIHYFPTVLMGRIIFGLGVGIVSPISINYINILVEPELRPTIQGYRMSSSLIGQGALTALAGGLFMVAWNLSFLIYALAFLCAGMVHLYIPDAKDESKNAKSQEKTKLPGIIFLIILFQVVILITAVAVEIRFPALAAYARGGEFNSSLVIALKAFLGILAGGVFGRLYQRFRQGVLYAALTILALSSFFMGFAGGNFWVKTGAFLLMSFVHGWMPAFLITTISKHTDSSNRNLAMALFLAGTNIGIFSMPFVVQWIEGLLGSDELAAPYPLFGMVTVGVLVTVTLYREFVYKRGVGV